MNQSLVKMEMGTLRQESRTLKLKNKPLREEMIAQQEVFITIEDNNQRLYRQMRTLMQRNNELLDVLADMQLELDKLKSENKLLLAPKNEETDLGNGRFMRNGVIVETGEGNTDFGFVKMRVSGLSAKRKQQRPTVEAQTKMLLAIYNHKGKGIAPDTLFDVAGLTKVTGYRYAKLFKMKGFIEFIGSNKTGWYEMTKLGRLFVEGRV